MERIQAVQRIGDQEILDLITTVIEDQRAPVGVFALARVGMLVDMGAVEPSHGVGILGKMRRYPVQNYPDVVLMTAVDQLHQIFRFAVARCRCVEIGNLITPGRTVRMLGQRQEFDMGESHFQYVGNQLIGQFPIRQEATVGMAPPGTSMDFVNSDWPFPDIDACAALHPGTIAPTVLANRVVDHARSTGRCFGVKGVRIGFEKRGSFAG